MKKVLIVAVLVLVAVRSERAVGQVADSIVLALMDQFNVPGLTLTVVRGDSTSTASWGYADADQILEVTEETPFRIASVAKIFVAATVVTEASRGTVSLKDDVSSLISSSGFEGPITLANLLTHTAGFDERYVGYAARSSDEMIPLGEYLADRMPSRGWPAGELVSYSNHGMSLAAWIVERSGGLSFAEIAVNDIFEPLGMYKTRFLRGGDRIPQSAADPLSCSEQGCEPVPHVFSHAYPAGLAFSTSRDMGRFIAAVLRADRGNSPLKALIPSRFTHDERIPGMSYGFFNQYHNGVRFLSHAGSVPGYWSLLMISPDEDFGFYFSTNGGASGFGERFRDELLAVLMEIEPARKPISVITEDPSLRAGTYELTRYSHDTIERFPQVFANSIRLVADGDTLMVVSGLNVIKYIQTGDALYNSIDGSDRIAFGTRRGRDLLFRSSFVFGAGLPAAYELRPWYLAPGFLNEYVSWLLAVPFLILFLLWPVTGAIGMFLRKRRGVERKPVNLAGGATFALAAGTATIFAVFGFGYVAKSNRLLGSGELFFGVPDALAALSWMPSTHVLLTGLMFFGLFLAWKNDWWDSVRRLLFSIVVAFLILQVVFLIQWNYLPISF